MRFPHLGLSGMVIWAIFLRCGPAAADDGTPSLQAMAAELDSVKEVYDPIVKTLAAGHALCGIGTREMLLPLLEVWAQSQREYCVARP